VTESSWLGQLVVSFVLAAFAVLCSPWVVFPLTKNNELTSDMFVLSAVIIGPTWAIMAVRVLRFNWKRGLWVLIGLPFALSSTWLFLMIPIGCAFWGNCL
jgi:hypothetical protein